MNGLKFFKAYNENVYLKIITHMMLITAIVS